MAESGSNGAKPVRRFVVQPIETTTISSKKKKAIEADEKPKRIFLPQLEETTTSSNRKVLNPRFLPQPVETIVRSSRKTKPVQRNESTQASAPSTKDVSSSERQFQPQWIETTKRTRRMSDGHSALNQADKTDISPGDRVHQPRHIRLRPTVMPDNHSSNSLQVPESRFSYASLSARRPVKKRSFVVPTLDPIEAGEESDASDGPPSLSTTPSAASEVVDARNEGTKVRRIHTESHDGKNMTGYMLSFAAQTAQKQLKEQALAAFPNEREHSAPNHFAFDNDSDEERVEYVSTDPDFYQRRLSNVGWDLVEMQRHKEILEEKRRQQKSLDERKQEAESNPWKNPYDMAALKNGVSENEEVTKMQHAARPPMLGSDLVFPQSLSPQHTMMDPTQRPVCNRHKSRGFISRQNSGLWTPHAHSPASTRMNTTVVKSKWLELTPSPGLWQGFCGNAEETKAKVQSGLMTPGYERPDPFSPAPTPLTPWHCQPHTPDLIPEAEDHLLGIDSVLQLEATLETEYPDSFITQVYNYLSLGYPALARDYDIELSKISRVPIEDIRRNDDDVDSRGHIGAPESEGWTERRTVEECGRWRALKAYIREWARQQPNFQEGSKSGMKARKGSWGI